jgi:hypothetical protein
LILFVASLDASLLCALCLLVCDCASSSSESSRRGYSATKRVILVHGSMGDASRSPRQARASTMSATQAMRLQNLRNTFSTAIDQSDTAQQHASTSSSPGNVSFASKSTHAPTSSPSAAQETSASFVRSLTLSVPRMRAVSASPQRGDSSAPRDNSQSPNSGMCRVMQRSGEVYWLTSLLNCAQVEDSPIRLRVKWPRCVA